MVMIIQDRATIDVIAGEIAAQFGETEVESKRLIGRALRNLGEERVRAFVVQALEVEATGGLMLPDGSRRRTPGGGVLSPHAQRYR